MDGTSRRVSVIILLASLCCAEIFSKELYIISPTGQICKNLDPTIVYNVTCKSKNVNRTFNLGSREIYYRPGIELSNYYEHILVYRKFATIYRQFMIDIVIDACALNNGTESAVSKILDIDKRRKDGNFYEPCPISGRRYENNIAFDYTSLPQIIPAGVYRVDVISHTIINGTKREILLTQNFGEAKTTTAEHWKK